MSRLQVQAILCNPALAVWVRLKPARNGRWVASTTLSCFQHPTPKGREACKPRREVGVPLKKCGFKRTHHAPSRKSPKRQSNQESSSSNSLSINC